MQQHLFSQFCFQDSDFFVVGFFLLSELLCSLRSKLALTGCECFRVLRDQSLLFVFELLFQSGYVTRVLSQQR